ncbi:hypothetical protein ACOSP7_015356 [Xanthoceras sorbifolium]|uniref:Protein NRT1/ PTR FAMILY 1.2-like n=1 Tax=Xanthoceras sorbifolium TaxID=99658 RepID=A0ABQ8I6M5_9ROSI|nr:hypothetical protein JRO89_XS04G0232100 [Xanthoceras sorbifolium]
MENTSKISDSGGVIRKKGGVWTMPFIISNETFEKVGSLGLQSNMIIYLIREYHMSVVSGATLLFLWSAMSNFTTIIGAFLADSYLGRYRVIAFGTILSLLGTIDLWLTAIIPGARPPPCKLFIEECSTPTTGQLTLLCASFLLMAMGAGCVRPCSLAFGADQFNNPDNPENQRILQSFFNWYYASVGISIMIAATVIVYIQEAVGWIVGFAVPVGLLLSSAILFLLGSSLYVREKANKNLFAGFAQVASAAWKKRHLALPPIISDGLYYHKGSDRLIAPTQKLSSLNKACIITNPETDLDCDGTAKEPWKLCTVKQVEELKALIKVLPVWSCGIITAVSISQYSFPVLQASSMDRQIYGGVTIPAGSFSVFALLTLTIWVVFYDGVLVPLISKFTKNKQGIPVKQRIALGMAISCMAMAVSALVETKRRNTAIREGLGEKSGGIVSMSAMWLVPQNVLIGLAEALNAIGQIEFYYTQFPKSMSSIGMALLSLGMGIGDLLGSLIVSVMDGLSKRDGKDSWVSSDINKGRYDYYYWVICFLSFLNFFYYLACSWTNGSLGDNRVHDESEFLSLEDENDMLEASRSPTL